MKVVMREDAIHEMQQPSWANKFVSDKVISCTFQQPRRINKP